MKLEGGSCEDPIKNFLQSSKIDRIDINADMCTTIENHINKYLQNLWLKIEQTPLSQNEKNHNCTNYSDSSSFPAIIGKKQLSTTKEPQTYLQALQGGIEEILSSDSSIYLFGQGLSSPWDSGKWVTDIYKSVGNSQIFESPNSESVTTAAAIGMAMTGVRCIVSHPRMDFLILAADPIANQAAKAFYMSGGNLKVPLVIRTQLYRGNCQGAQHSQALQSWFSHLPGLRVVMPSTPSDVRDLLYSSVFSDDPVLFIDDKWLHDWIIPDEYHKVLELKDEGPRVLIDGQDITLVGMGYTTRLCHEVAQELIKKNIKCEVIDLRILNPINCETIIKSCKKTKSLLVVDMSWPQCSVSSEIIAQVSENLSGSDIRVKMKRINTPNHPAPASMQDENKFYIDSKKIELTVLDMI